MFPRRTHEKPVPRLVSSGDSKIQAAIEIGCIEAEQLPPHVARIVFQRVEDPQQRIPRFGFGLHLSELRCFGNTRGVEQFTAPAAR
jgi:hypothetical protein